MVVDGLWRGVYQDGDRQYVYVEDDERVYRVWWVERDECDERVVVGE